MSEVIRVRDRNPDIRLGAPAWAGSLAASASFCILCLSYFLLSTDQAVHWFVIPVTLCGILIGWDAVDWFRQRVDLFDPVGIIGLLGFHFFFLAPLLHVHWDRWMPYIIPPPDWRDWLGGMAALNLLGLLIYRSTRRLFAARHVDAQRLPRTWRLRRERFGYLLIFSLALTGTLQLWVYARFGGVLGYIQAFESREDQFEGMGWIFMLSESFPILAFIGLVAILRGRGLKPSWVVHTLILFAFFVLTMLFGGLRGSRSNTIWILFWAVGIIHFWIRPVPMKLAIMGIFINIIFVYLYGFYKAEGLEGLKAIGAGEGRIEMEQRSGAHLGRRAARGFQQVRRPGLFTLQVVQER